MISLVICVVITVAVLLWALGRAQRFDNKINNTSTVMEKTLNDYFSKIGDIDYYECEEISSLASIKDENTYIIKKKDGQIFVKLLANNAIYDPTIYTIVKQVKDVEIIPSCDLFKFRKVGEEFWRKVYIIVVSPRNMDYSD